MHQAATSSRLSMNLFRGNTSPANPILQHRNGTDGEIRLLPILCTPFLLSLCRRMCPAQSKTPTHSFWAIGTISSMKRNRSDCSVQGLSVMPIDRSYQKAMCTVCTVLSTQSINPTIRESDHRGGPPSLGFSTVIFVLTVVVGSCLPKCSEGTEGCRASEMKLLVGRTASLEPKWAGKKVNVHQDFDAEFSVNTFS